VPQWGYASAMTEYFYAHQIRIFDYPCTREIRSTVRRECQRRPVQIKHYSGAAPRRMVREARPVGEKHFKHSGDGIRQCIEWLLEWTAGDSSAIAVAIEVPHGAMVEGMIENSLAVFAIRSAGTCHTF
jgi:hypothetical protein